MLPIIIVILISNYTKLFVQYLFIYFLQHWKLVKNLPLKCKFSMSFSSIQFQQFIKIFNDSFDKRFHNILIIINFNLKWFNVIKWPTNNNRAFINVERIQYIMFCRKFQDIINYDGWRLKWHISTWEEIRIFKINFQ